MIGSTMTSVSFLTSTASLVVLDCNDSQHNDISCIFDVYLLSSCSGRVAPMIDSTMTSVVFLTSTASLVVLDCNDWQHNDISFIF